MLRVLLLLLPLCYATLLPRPTGPYQLTLNVSQLIDTSRKDPWGKDTVKYRRLMISRFDPLPLNTCYRNKKVSYMPPSVSAAMDGIFTPFGLPAGIFGSLDMVVCSQPDYYKPNETWPVVLFSPGFNATRLLYSILAQEIASQGYTVITIDHPFDTSVEFLDGTVIYGGNVNFSDINAVNHALDIRANDISFVLNTLGIQYNAPPNASALIFGHSFGGATAAAAMLNDTRLRGGVNLDGRLFGGVINAGLGRPGINQSFILWGAEGRNASEPEWETFYQNLKREGMFERELVLLNMSHIAFSDLPLVIDVIGIRNTLSAGAQAVVGSLPGKRVIQILSKYLTDYARFVLRGNEVEGLLSKPNKEYPEVVFLG
ncbi:Alpha/Beta hydrolase protein [Tricladium varicosporioides]|nr:Alpha/Beta hydrolase protein [Hymenoscyphus varicosporioides]